ncbi:MAG: hypothetical protein N3C12_05745 [Candidatus Binatia bacterium]|nr:hypothetical protein [Candidatus Binatia bacterium]
MNPPVCRVVAACRPAGVRCHARRRWWLFVVPIFVALVPNTGWAGPFADAVVAFRPGAGAGYGQDRLPEVVLGPPHGGGLLEGSLDVVSLGHGGEIVLRFDPPVACDGPGPDLLVFENAFHVGSATGPVFAELAFVAVSQDGVHFREFPWNAQTWDGLAGKTPVLSNPENGIDPRDPSVAGGDAFDLAQVGLEWIRFVRITDVGNLIDDPGNRLPGGGTAGFDLDAVAAVYPCTPETAASPSPTPSLNATPTATPTPSTTPTPTATPQPPPTSSPTAMCPIAEALWNALFESSVAADWNDDGRLSVADLVAALRQDACSQRAAPTRF